MNRRLPFSIFGAGLSVGGVDGLAGCTSSDGPWTDTAPVDGALVETTDRNTSEPEPIAVSIGEPVVSRSDGAASHTVTAYESEIPVDAA